MVRRVLEERGELHNFGGFFLVGFFVALFVAVEVFLEFLEEIVILVDDEGVVPAFESGFLHFGLDRMVVIKHGYYNNKFASLLLLIDCLL